MTDPNYVLLYVDNPVNSANFYARLLNKQPVETSSTFALFALDSGIMLGLWSKHTVEPAAIASGGASELAISVASNEEVDVLYMDWCQRKLNIIQTPVDLDFGYTFVAADPDGHRLRIFALSE
ncbi:hypothetical protein BIY29_08725 [Brenneria alni]|uniref:Phenazine antibiotic resistance protein n=1 Tax=Brenneria alni TaxID=71656 RepID=A0A421DP38_9GAMM|nr:VOC family protein [Brenneria alni]RLM24477.1 hypothetical protein BIY29_08725 [Brenneria alni]